ncbi:M23 family metallopeptidase [Aurantiacibacter poecillastricola]|uniref:M23 family metallopeptidase n=1 Tax=Aurantiacibacter poecillastricola TaxID=3064385 RepID=UPI00273FE109|nr:M23 family metallopeptidase [Aurantiacibacter sp. 219JJ12-13]MDP5260467.1 M23 family metallopeptidase [Aurantiacibacter sp. 219JJ12-13]
MRSKGQVRFLTVTSRTQMIAAGTASAIALACTASLGVAAISQWQASSERASLMEREAQVATKEDRYEAYSKDIDGIVADLKARQDLLDGIVEMLPEDVVVETADTVTDSSVESEQLIGMIGRVFPSAVGLAQMEARQLAFAERLTRYADRRAARAEEAIRELGLDPDAVLRSNEMAMGGPLENLASESDGSMDPRFERLGLSLARMSALERGLDQIPQVMPADLNSISSGYGPRRDPFRGTAAMHRGLDFRAPHGSPIFAAAAGRVRFAGWRSGYGKVVEIDHGAGLVTRYAHMSAFKSKVGDEVLPGAVIGAIGSTGRSTGPHLHFEVRINNQAVNPRPFLETAPHVLEQVRAEFAPSDGQASGETNG